MPVAKSKQKTTTTNFGLRGVGPHMAKQLARLDILSVQDLLLHLPARYQDRTKIQAIKSLLPDSEAVIEGVIARVSQPPSGRTKLMCELHDDTGVMYLRFFHVLNYQTDAFKPGSRLRCYSHVRLGPRGLEMVHPEFQVINENQALPIEQHFTPIYPATEGVSQYMLRKLTQNALSWMQNGNSFEELLPQSLLQSLAFPSLQEALQFVHRPPRQTTLEQLSENKTQAQKRLVFEELLAHRLSLLHMKKVFQSRGSFALTPAVNLIKKFLENLPFKLTSAQHKVHEEITADLSLSQPMLRLVQGDVGSGKTIIGALAMLQAIDNNYQAALMAPTELLAEQHLRNFKRWFDCFGINIAFLSGTVKGKAREEVLENIASGTAQIVIGTHALFQEAVEFKSLALIVVDEQHRFGVHQRAMLREKGKVDNCYPHQLVMTATPIPRTLAMSLYADLDVSIIDELPPGRTPIVTTVLPASRREEIIARIAENCKQGRQVYWVCPLIEESELLACQAATQTAEDLAVLLPGLSIGLIHGRMKAEEKDQAMKNFQIGITHVLVATTVIEVGVDVPNASVMVIENAERMGLSQLHQLRGRVGRGSVASYCVLLFQYPLSAIGRERLAVMRETTDGFKIAQRDLELRGAGEVLGTRQTGEIDFYVADLIRDSDMLTVVHSAADIILENHADKVQPLIKRWLGFKNEYVKV